MAATKSNPKDAQVMTAILKDMGVLEYEPRIVNQMLEFTYRYVTTILDDARVFSSHAKKKMVDVDDVRLSIQLQMDKSFTSTPPRDLLVDIARQKNTISMPLIKANVGPRLPPDRYSLTSSNFRMKPLKKTAVKRANAATGRIGYGSMNIGTSLSTGSSTSGKVTPAINLGNKTGATLSVVNKGLGPTVTVSTKPLNKVAIGSKATPTPIIKFSAGAPAIRTSVTSGVMSVKTDPTNGISEGTKRKREDDDYDVE